MNHREAGDNRKEVSREDLLLVVILYNIGPDRLTYLESLHDIDILIYDNSPCAHECPPGIHYHHDPRNPGVSAGYNYALRLAEGLLKKYVITLDQDTDFSEEILQAYCEMKEKYGENYIYAPIVCGNKKIYSPFIVKRNHHLWQAAENFYYSEIYPLRNQSLINSGLMIPIRLANEIGGYNEKIKLDFSDTYLMKKYRERKDEIILIHTELEHRLSGDEGKDREKELRRFRYYCNGAREYRRSFTKETKTGRFVFFRAIRLVMKYHSLLPLSIVRNDYLGEETI